MVLFFFLDFLRASPQIINGRPLKETPAALSATINKIQHPKKNHMVKIIDNHTDLHQCSMIHKHVTIIGRCMNDFLSIVEVVLRAIAPNTSDAGDSMYVFI